MGVVNKMARPIILTKHLMTLVDNDDYLKYNNIAWCAGNKGKNTFYAVSSFDGKLLHRVIMNAPKGVTVDHINGNTLDNRKCNLRLASYSQNCANRRIQSNNTSGYRGVYYDSSTRSKNKWKAQISFEGKNMHIGRFYTKEQAFDAYDKKKKEYFGEFAYVDKIP